MSNAVRVDEFYRTPEEYLAAEALSETKHEYLNGFVYAMAGASRAHNQIASNLLFRLRAQLEGKPCTVLGSDMRLQVSRPGSGFYYYPDVMVDCSGSSADMVEEPTVIFEILSPQSGRADFGEKAVIYQFIDSLRVYVIVNQDRSALTLYRRGENGAWRAERLEDANGTLALPEIGCSLPLPEIYERVFS